MGATLTLTSELTEALEMLEAFQAHAIRRGMPRMERIDNAMATLKSAFADANRAQYLRHIEDNTEGHLGAVIDFAREVGALPELDRCLRSMFNWCHSGRGKVRLWRDGRPEEFSFYFELLAPDGRREFNGGVIYRGPGRPLDGSGPAFTVSLSPSSAVHSWSIHT